MSLNTENIPDISFIENSSIEEVRDALINDFLDKYEELTGNRVSLSASNPYRLIMMACANQIYQAMQYADHAGKMSFLTYASGDYLDNLAALRGVTRRDATAAKTTLEFSISSAIASAVAIPAGTRVTNGNGVYFATDEYTEIPAGSLTASVTATCTEAGTSGSGFSSGEFTTLVNTLAYTVNVTNSSETYGGSDIETDEELKERIFEAPGGYSTAGPNDAYIFHAKDASADVGDVYVTTESAGEVDVYFITAAGEIPSAALIAEVESYLDDKKIRPLTDHVVVKAPSISTYNIDVTYYIAASNTASVAAIQENVTAAVNAYNIWQQEKIGRDINPSNLIQRIIAAGAKRVVVNAPTYTVLNESTIAQKGIVTVNYGGVESD